MRVIHYHIQCDAGLLWYTIIGGKTSKESQVIGKALRIRGRTYQAIIKMLITSCDTDDLTPAELIWAHRYPEAAEKLQLNITFEEGETNGHSD